MNRSSIAVLVKETRSSSIVTVILAPSCTLLPLAVVTAVDTVGAVCSNAVVTLLVTVALKSATLLPAESAIALVLSAPK